MRIPALGQPHSAVLCTVLFTAAMAWAAEAPGPAGAQAALQRLGTGPGVCAVLGLPRGSEAGFVTALAEGSAWQLYVQATEAEASAAVRQSADAAGLLGRRVFVDRGAWDRVHLADDLADAVIVSGAAVGEVPEPEVLRVLRPGGRALIGERELAKPFPAGTDAWSHPYHGPDNNPQSTDRLARAPYLTKFLAEPLFAPMPEVSVAAGGRVFRAFGHIAHKTNQNGMLNTLICVNGYNGTILWSRPLPEGFMIHRNTLVATADTLYLADHRSCQRIDAATGKTRDEIVVPEGLSDGPVWKWLALVDGTLYALVGAPEVQPATQPSKTRGLGHWPWGMWEGHDYKDPRTSFGFGRTFLAIEVATKKLLWSHREEDYVDARGVCLGSGRIYFCCPEKQLVCLDAGSGALRWRNSSPELLAAIGPNASAQHYVTGYATTTYSKCNERFIFFAGPQRSRLVAARTEDGSLAWQREGGNLLLVLRDDAIYAAGPQATGPNSDPESGVKLAYETGEVLGRLAMRRACTRATGSIDSIFFRAAEGTVRIETATNRVHHIAPMRPPCQDGVIIADGHLYWGPWMCGCPLSLYGHIALTAAGDFSFRPGADDSRCERTAEAGAVAALEVRDGDWPAFQGDNARSSVTRVALPGRVSVRWRREVPAKTCPTAPITAGGLVFVGDRNGGLWAVDGRDGKVRWNAHAGGAIQVAPALADGRLFAGSADGRVYAFEAATGRPLWTFRAAPSERWIPVYGRLMSTWPVAGGVVVQDGVVYAAAGIAHYDGTHVYALDAATGQVKWYNDTSGTLSEKVDHGVSLQGELAIRNGELRFPGGGAYEEARYDLATGKCLNGPNDVPGSAFHTAYYPYFPEYGRYVSLDLSLPDGRMLSHDSSYEGSWQSALAMLPPGTKQDGKPLSRWGLQWRRGEQPAAQWRLPADRRYSAFMVGSELLLTAGHTGDEPQGNWSLSAIRLADGTEAWREALPAAVVRGGLATDSAGRIVVALENGQVVCFGAAE
jgi:outer membrane protein assembly factor BamB